MGITFQEILGVGVILGLTAMPGATTAQETRTTTGQIIGEAEWEDIDPAESELEIEGRSNFAIQRKVFPGRYIESWVERRSSSNGGVLRLSYERLNNSTFRGDNFAAEFRNLAESIRERFGDPSGDVRYERLARGFRAAILPRDGRNCIYAMRIYGFANTNVPGVSGDRNIRISACGNKTADDQLLIDTAIAFAASLKQDGIRSGVPGTDPGNFETLVARLFDGYDGATAPQRPRDRVGWNRQRIEIDWDGNPEMSSGTIFLKDEETRGRILITVPGAFDQCNGNYNFDIGRAGAWNLKCNKGRTATGTFEMKDDGWTAGTGTDNKGAAIRFTMSPG